MTTLLEIKDALRRRPQHERRSFTLDSAKLAVGYHEMVRTAPRRALGYLSDRRTGLPSGSVDSNRREEHLAIALRNRGYLVLPGGERLDLIDYQFPLKAAQSDGGIGKIDLVGLFSDGTLAVVELKLAQNGEDRRIALVEGLIYAAIVECNIETIVDEFTAKLDGVDATRVKRERPRVLLIGEGRFWRQPGAFPGADDMRALIDRVMRDVPIGVSALTLSAIKLDVLGGNGAPPRISGEADLSPL